MSSKTTTLFVMSAALAMSGFAASPAAAAVTVNGTITGTVVSGVRSHDDTHLFGADDLLGKPFTLTFRYDLAQAPFGDGATFAGGGTDFGGNDPFGMLDLTINGLTHSFEGGYSSQISTGTGGFSLLTISHPLPYTLISGGISDPAMGLPATFADAGAAYDLAAGSAANTLFFEYGPDEGGDAFTDLYLHANTAVFNSTAVAAVPEAGIWVMMLGGLALAGGAARRRARVMVRRAT